MRSCLALAVGMLALARVAGAQTPPAAADADKGYVEAVAQSAFGNVTSQSYGVEGGFVIKPTILVFGEVGHVGNVATASMSTAAAQIAGFLSQTQSNVGFTVTEPVSFAVGGIKYVVPTSGKIRPYVLGGFGVATVNQNAKFTINGSDVTSTLTQYGVQLGTDLSGSFTKPMLVIGGGATYPVWQRMILDFQFRYGRIFAEDEGINVGRVGVGIGIRF